MPLYSAAVLVVSIAATESGTKRRDVELSYYGSLEVATFDKLSPSAQGFLKSLSDVACSAGVVDRGSWLRIAQQYLSCALVRGLALCSATILRVCLKVLEKTVVVVLVCHSSQCG